MIPNNAIDRSAQERRSCADKGSGLVFPLHSVYDPLTSRPLRIEVSSAIYQHTIRFRSFPAGDKPCTSPSSARKKLMAGGLPRFRSFRGSSATAARPTKQWPRPKCSHFARWPSALNTASPAGLRSAFSFRLPHESLAIHQSQATARGTVWYWMEGETPGQLSSDSLSREG